MLNLNSASCLLFHVGARGQDVPRAPGYIILFSNPQAIKNSKMSLKTWFNFVTF